MKILFSLTYYYPHISGLTIYVNRVCELLANKGYPVTVVCMAHQKGLKNKDSINKVSVIRARTLIKIYKGYISGEWVFKSIAEVVRSDVVVINLPQIEGIFPLIAAKILQKKVVAIYHAEVQIKNKALQYVVEFFNKLTVRMADKVIAYTEDLAKNSVVLKNNLKKITYIYPIIPSASIDEHLTRDIKIKIGDGIMIGMAARLAEEKGFEYLIEAIDKLNSRKIKNKPTQKRIKLVVAGPTEISGEEKYREKIMNIADKYKGDIFFLGAIPADKMGSFYSILDILAVPSINSTETFGIVQVEAMRMGIPVVASNLPGVRVAVQKTGMGMLTRIADPESIANAIEMVLIKKKDFKNRQSFVESEFNQKVISDKFVDFFENMNTAG